MLSHPDLKVLSTNFVKVSVQVLSLCGNIKTGHQYHETYATDLFDAGKRNRRFFLRRANLLA